MFMWSGSPQASWQCTTFTTSAMMLGHACIKDRIDQDGGTTEDGFDVSKTRTGQDTIWAICLFEK